MIRAIGEPLRFRDRLFYATVLAVTFVIGGAW
jgi:hypothetical protein